MLDTTSIRDTARTRATRPSIAAPAAPLAVSSGWQPYAVLILVYIFAGLTGHDPWKADEAYVFGVVQHMYDSADWLVPTLAGYPFMEKPPLFYWVATGCAHLLSGWLPLHDGARLAAAFFMLITCWALASASRLWWGRDGGRYAVMVLIACFGSLVQSHLMMPDIALLTGFALSALGFATVRTRVRAGGVLLGLGAGIAFLSKGLLGPAVMAATALLLPVCFYQWRGAAYRRGLALAALVSAPWCLIWPIALYLRAPALFIDWFWINNIGRFFGFSVAQLGAEHLPWFWTQTIPWFTFPGLPLALWTLWQKRRGALSEPPVQFALVAFGVLMVVLSVSSSGRCVYAWPLMVPIAILAAPGATRLPKAADLSLAMAAAVLFGLLSGAIWTGWAIMMRTGAPPAWPRVLRLLPAEFVPRFEAGPALCAVALTLGAAALMRTLWRRPGRGLAAWVIGLTLTWSLLSTLWMPWLDYAKSYRAVFVAMPIPADANCVSSMFLGEGERAMLRYVRGRDAVRLDVTPRADCTILLVQYDAALGAPALDPTKWRQIWLGSRPGVTSERFWLYSAIK